MENFIQDDKARSYEGGGMITIGSLFSGIGGFELGLERAGFGPVKWQVEIDDFCNRILAKHWPDVTRYRDIRDVGKHNLEPVDLICGGFPCQPFSVAGKRKGTADDRYLWPEMVRVISEVKPVWVIGENVPGIVPMELDKVLSDLEGEGYETTTLVIPACAVNAPHRRDRVWIVACDTTSERLQKCQKSELIQPLLHAQRADSDAPDTQHKRCIGRSRGSDTNGNGIQAGEQAGREPRSAVARCDEDATDSIKPGLERRRQLRQGTREQFVAPESWEQDWVEVATRLCRVDDGVSDRVHRLKCLGNAVVPQVVEAIGRILWEWLEQQAQQ